MLKNLTSFNHKGHDGKNFICRQKFPDMEDPSYNSNTPPQAPFSTSAQFAPQTAAFSFDMDVLSNFSQNVPAPSSGNISEAFNQLFEKPKEKVSPEDLNCSFDEIYRILQDNVLFRCQTPESNIMLRYLYSMLILGFIVPLCIICFCYGMIITKEGGQI